MRQRSKIAFIWLPSTINAPPPWRRAAEAGSLVNPVGRVIAKPYTPMRVWQLISARGVNWNRDGD